MAQTIYNATVRDLILQLVMHYEMDDPIILTDSGATPSQTFPEAFEGFSKEELTGTGRETTLFMVDGYVCLSDSIVSAPTPPGPAESRFDRCFASPDIGDQVTKYAGMREWSKLEQETTMDEIRGGGGDELAYDTKSDTFSFQPGSGCGEGVQVKNPRPNDVIAGARIVAMMTDAYMTEDF